jgi:hypothetical protein
MQGFSFGAMSAPEKEINFNQVMIIKINAKKTDSSVN